MCSLLQRLTTKADIDEVIKNTADRVLVLRFGQENDPTCMRLDDILSRCVDDLRLMAAIYCVEADTAPVYVQYFDITLIPATVFFFNGQHMKVDWGRPDNTKFIGSFKSRQDVIDVVEVLYRGAMKGKLQVRSPLDDSHVPKYDLVYKDI